MVHANHDLSCVPDAPTKETKMKFSNTTKKLGAAIAVAFALGTPLLAASSASAEPYRYEEQRGDRGYGHSHMRFDHRPIIVIHRDFGWHARNDHMRGHEHSHFDNARFNR
jgi:hypothetical protein